MTQIWTAIQHYGPDHLGVCLNEPDEPGAVGPDALEQLYLQATQVAVDIQPSA